MYIQTQSDRDITSQPPILVGYTVRTYRFSQCVCVCVCVCVCDEHKTAIL